MALNLHLATLLKEYISESGEVLDATDKPGSSAFIQWPALELGGNNKKVASYSLTARCITYSVNDKGFIPPFVFAHKRSTDKDGLIKAVSSATRNMLLYKGAEASEATIGDMLKSLISIDIPGLMFEVSYFVREEASNKRIGVFYDCMGSDGPVTTVIVWLAIDLKESF